MRLEAALEIAEVNRLLPVADGYELEAKLGRIDVLLSECRVPEALRVAFHETSRACWIDNETNIDIHDQPGFDSARLGAQAELATAIRGELMRTRSRSERRDLSEKAVTLAGASAPELSQAEQDSELFQ